MPDWPTTTRLASPGPPVNNTATSPKGGPLPEDRPSATVAAHAVPLANIAATTDASPINPAHAHRPYTKLVGRLRPTCRSTSRTTQREESAPARAPTCASRHHPAAVLVRP